MNSCRLAAAGLIGALLAGTCLAAEPADVPKPIDTSYTGADSYFVLVMNIGQILKHPARNKDARDLMLKMMFEESNMNFADLDQIVMQMGSDRIRDEDGQAFDFEYAFTVTMRFSKPINRKDILASVLDEDAEAVELDGLTYYRVESDYQPALFFPDDRSFVMAMEPRLKRVIAQKYTMSPIVNRLRDADGRHDVIAVASAAPAREFLKMFFDEVDLVGLVDADLIVNNLDSGTLTATLNSEVPIRLELNAKNEKAALKVKAKADELFKMAKEAYPFVRKELLDNDRNKELAKLGVNVLDTLIQGTKIRVKEDRVIVELESEDGFVKLVDLFFESFAADFEDVEERRIEVEAEFRELEAELDRVEKVERGERKELREPVKDLPKIQVETFPGDPAPKDVPEMR